MERWHQESAQENQQHVLCMNPQATFISVQLLRWRILDVTQR